MVLDNVTHLLADISQDAQAASVSPCQCTYACAQLPHIHAPVVVVEQGRGEFSDQRLSQMGDRRILEEDGPVVAVCAWSCHPWHKHSHPTSAFTISRWGWKVSVTNVILSGDILHQLRNLPSDLCLLIIVEFSMVSSVGLMHVRLHEILGLEKSSLAVSRVFLVSLCSWTPARPMSTGQFVWITVVIALSNRLQLADVTHGSGMMSLPSMFDCKVTTGNSTDVCCRVRTGSVTIKMSYTIWGAQDRDRFFWRICDQPGLICLQTWSFQ